MKRAANLSVDTKLLDEAKALNINLSQTLETALKAKVAKSRAAQWKKENAEAIKSSNAWVEKNGLPLEKYRMF